MQSTYATYELARSRQDDLIREAKAARLAAEARAQSSEAKAAPWESRIGRIRHVFAVFSALPTNTSVRLARPNAGA
ncbi:MAG TPA: hypothetical protein VGK63_10080 [Candidatus Limnocylindrales bacterium]